MRRIWWNGSVNTKDRLIACFRRLCETHGVETIAEKTHSNVEGMRQIQRGRKLASGEPRGVGPTIQKRLDKHYPGWSSLVADSPEGVSLNQGGDGKLPVTYTPDLSYAGRPKNSTKVPVVGTAKLGTDGFYVELESPTGFGDGYVEHYSNDANAYGVRVKGDSMHPAIKHGQVVIVEPSGALVPGENVLVSLRDGRKMVKELVTGRPDSITLVSVNGGDRITIQREEVEFIHAVAAVVSASKWRPE